MAKRKTREKEAYKQYLERTGFGEAPITAALIDMDGVLYDSMKNHTKAWIRLSEELGWNYSPDEFYLYEGMTGAAIIRLMMKRETGRDDVSDEEAKEIYAKKAEYFRELGNVDKIEGADMMLATLRSAGIKRVLVTGSGQHSLLDRLNADYPGIFSEDLKVTALDVKRGKPDPEPYLMGLEKAGVKAENAIVIENAPLGVRAGVAAGIFTIGVNTGPLPDKALADEGASLVFPSMSALGDAWQQIMESRYAVL